MKLLFAIFAVAFFSPVLSQTSTTQGSSSTDSSSASTEASTTSTVAPIGSSTELPTGSTASSALPTGSTASSELPTGSTASSELPTGSTASSEPPTGSTASSELPTGSTASTELSTGSTELSTASTELSTASTEISTASTELPTPSTKASTITEPTITTPTTSSTTNEPSTAVPELKDCTWNVTEGNVTCIRAEMKAQFIIASESNETTLILGCDAVVLNDDCSSNSTQALVLFEDGKYNLTMIFERDSDKYSVRNITLDFTLPDGEKGFASYDSDKLFTAKVGNSYLCKSNTDVKFENVTMKISKIQIQAFAEKGTTKFGDADECSTDNDPVSDVIPIAVGVVLVTLVIVVLIAYLIGRRRSRQRGYQNFHE